MNRRPQLERMSEGAWRVPGVEVFASGTHRDKEYTPADIDQMVANFNRFSTPRPGKKPLLRVPAVLGHEEEQDLLERSDLPAAAWGLRAFARNGKDAEGKPQRIMCVDLEDAPPAVARLLHGKAYRTVSAEVYDEPPDGIPGKGKMLRRIALLGGDIPQVKTLADIPTPEPMHERFAAGRPVLLRFREARKKSAPGASKTWLCFSEVTPMGRDELLRKLQSLGFDVSRITDAVGDEVLEEMCRALDGKQSQEQMADGDTDPALAAQQQMADEQVPVDDKTSQKLDDMLPPARTDEERAELAERCGKFASRFGRMAEALQAKYAELTGSDLEDDKKFDEDDAPDSEADRQFAEKFAQAAGQKAMWAKVSASGTNRVSKGGNYNKGTMAGKWSEKMTEAQFNSAIQLAVNRALKQHVGGTVAELKKFHEETVAGQKKASVDAICERLFKEGKLPPAERQDFHDALMLADSKTVVRKFAEKGKTVELTPFDLLVRMADKRPTLFGERFKNPASTGGDTNAEVEKVTRFSESPQMADGLRAAGRKPADFVQGFKDALKLKPGLTAVEYGVPPHYAA